MNIYDAFIGFIYRWLTAPLVAGAAIIGALRLFWQEWLMLEAFAGYGIALFNFIWSQVLFQKIRNCPFDEFLIHFFMWSGLKSLIIFLKACAVLTFTTLDPVRFIVCLLIAYLILMFSGFYSMIKRPVLIKS